MIASPNNSPRGSAPVRLVVVHTAEGSRRKEDLGRYFQGDVNASSHVGIDAGGIEPYVSYDRSAWTLLNGNPISDNAELCAFAEMTRAQWFSEVTITFYSQALRRNVTVDSPKRLLDNTAAWIRERCLARNIPIRKLTPAQIDAGWAGVIGHIDWSVSAIGQGDHSDPEGQHYGKGTGFPWDYVIARASGATIEEDDMAGEGPEILALLRNLDNWLLKGGPGPDAVYAGKAVPGLGRSSAVAVLHDNNKALRAVYELTGKPIGAVLVELLNRDPADLDEAAVATALLPALTAAVDRLGDVELDRVAQAVADEQDRRARDNDPTTGPTS